MTVRKSGFTLVRLLLLVPYIAMLAVPFYNRTLPELAGIPFFYWYQLMWIPLAAVLILAVYRAENRDRQRSD
jgi:uncharacterized membrane protein